MPLSQFRLPDLGEGLEEAQLVQWLVRPGETVALNQPLCQVETAKALVDVPSPYAGVVKTLHAQPGETVPVGAPLVTIETSESGATSAAPTDASAGPVLVGYGTEGPAQTFTRRRRGVEMSSAPAASQSAAMPPPVSAPPTNGADAKASPARAQDRAGTRHQPRGNHRNRTQWAHPRRRPGRSSSADGKTCCAARGRRGAHQHRGPTQGHRRQDDARRDDDPALHRICALRRRWTGGSARSIERHVANSPRRA